MAASTMKNHEIYNNNLMNALIVPGEEDEASSALTRSSPDTTMDLKRQLEPAPNELNELQIRRQKLDERNEEMIISEQRHQLMEILIRKDHHIHNLSATLKNLETQLQSAVSAKFDALARLQKIEGKELALIFKEKKMDSDVDRLNSKIKALTDELSENLKELTAVRHELQTAYAQYDIDINEKSELLRLAYLSVAELGEKNQRLIVANDECESKLQQQLIASRKLMKAYDDDLKATTTLAEMYKEKNVVHEAEVDELASGINKLRELLNGTLEEYEQLGTLHNETQLDRQTEAKASEKTIAELKRELENANSLLTAYKRNESGDGDISVNLENDTGTANEMVNNLPHSIDHPMTFTELYSRYCSVAKQLHDKELECNVFEAQMTCIIDDVRKKAIEFETQQSELKWHKEAVATLIEERANLVVEKVICREELESSRLQCELLKVEVSELKSFRNSENGRQVCTIDESTEELKRSIVEAKVNETRLEHEKQQLQDLIRYLGVQRDGLEPNEPLANSTLANDEDVTGGDESVKGAENDSSVNSDMRNKIPSARSQPETLLKIEELTQANCSLQSAVKELTAEKISLLAQKNLSDAQKNLHDEQLKTINEQNRKYVNIIDEQGIAIKYLRTENANATVKLTAAEERLLHLSKQNGVLSHMKDELVVEVEALKQELSREKVSNKTLLEMLKTSMERPNNGSQIVQREMDGPTKLSTDEALQTDPEEEVLLHKEPMQDISQSESGICSDNMDETDSVDPNETIAVVTQAQAVQKEVDIKNHHHQASELIAIVRNEPMVDFGGTDIEIEDKISSDFAVPKDTTNDSEEIFFSSLQLKKSEALVTVAEAPVTVAEAPVTVAEAPVTVAEAPVTVAEPPTSNSSSKINTRKRKAQVPHPQTRSLRLRPKKQCRVSFINLTQDDDEEDINVCDVDIEPMPENIELQYLSEVRTRKQAKFIHDAFHNTNNRGTSSRNVEPVTSKDKKVSKPKSPQCSKRSRSASRGRSTGRQISTRSRSVGDDYQSTTNTRRDSATKSSGRGENTKRANPTTDQLVINSSGTRKSCRLINCDRQVARGKN